MLRLGLDDMIPCSLHRATAFNNLGLYLIYHAVLGKISCTALVQLLKIMYITLEAHKKAGHLYIKIS